MQVFDGIIFTNWSIAAIIGGSVAIGGVILYAIIHGKLPLPSFMRISIDDLVKTQIVDDEFDGVSLLRWIKRNRRDNVKVVVVKPTQSWIKKLNLKDAKNIDAEKNLLAYMIDDDDKLLTMQLFTFSSISPTMSAKFSSTGEMVLSS